MTHSSTALLSSIQLTSADFRHGDRAWFVAKQYLSQTGKYSQKKGWVEIFPFKKCALFGFAVLDGAIKLRLDWLNKPDFIK